MKQRIKKLMMLMLISVSSMMIIAGCSNAADTETEAESNEEVAASSDDTAEEEDADVQEDEVGTYPDGTSPEFSDTRLRLTIDNQEVIIRMYDNTAVDAFLERLPLEDLNFSDLSGIEKPVDRPDEEFSIADETPGYDPVTGDMVIYRPWGNFTIFYGDFRHSDELVPLGKVESGLDIVAGQTEDFTGTLELVEE